MAESAKQKRYFAAFVCFLFVSMFGAAACQKRVVRAEKDSPVLTAPNRIVVLPFVDMYRLYGDNVSFRCPLCGSTYEIGPVVDDAVRVLTDRLVERLGALTQSKIVLPDDSQGIRSAILHVDGKMLSEKEILMETARIVDADAVLLGRVYRFEERVGVDYSAVKPASVTFDLLLIGVPDGRVLWQGNFSETQQPLSSNLFKLKSFFKRKGRWITARQMALGGLDQVLRDFPKFE